MVQVLRRGQLIEVPAGQGTPPPPRTPPMDGMAFLARLSDAEYASIMQAAATMLGAGQPQMSRWIDMLRLSGTIRLDGEDAQGAKTALVAGGLLTQERADDLFSP